MKLCETCKKVKCSKSIVITEQENITIVKSIEYEKDEEKIKGYTQPLWTSARKHRSWMELI